MNPSKHQIRQRLTMLKTERPRVTTPFVRWSREGSRALVLLLLAVAWAWGSISPAWGQEAEEEAVALPRRWVVVMDPGHGGKNEGILLNRAGNISEKTILVQLALAVKTVLRQQALVDVYLTRKRDEPLSISERITLANRKGTDVFISLHLTGASAERAAQPRLFVNRVIQDPVILKIEQKHKAAGAVVVPWDLAQNDQIKYSLRLAKLMQSAWKNTGHEGAAPDAVVFTDLPIAVLSGLASPGILLEVPPPGGDLTPENLEADYINPQAKWIARGILRFIRSR